MNDEAKGKIYMNMTRIHHTWLFLIIGIVLFSGTVSTVFAQEVKWMKIGDLQTWFRADGSEPEVGRTGLQADQQDGMIWPAQFNGETNRQDNMAAKGLWIGTTNYKDAEQYGSNTYPYKVVHVGPRGWDTQREFMPIIFKMYGKINHPDVYVDEVPGSDLMWNDAVDEVDPNLPADRMIYTKVNTSIGITMTRKIYGWGQQFNNDYFIEDYVFKNTGNIDPDPDIEQPDKILTGVRFFYQYRYAISREGAEGTAINSTRWGINTMLSTRGEAASDTTVSGFTYPGNYQEWLNGNTNADSLRAKIAWAGRHHESSYDVVGYPDVAGGTGRLQGPQYIGVVTLHADKSPADPSDDPLQPKTTTYQQSDDPPTRPNDQFDGSRMSAEWQWITRGHRLPRFDQAVGNGYPDQLEGTPGGFSAMNGYGPYTLNPGDSVHIVIAVAVNGLDRDKAKEIGAVWYANRNASSGSYTLPDGSTTSDINEYKDKWVYTGQDSIFKVFGQARQNYQLMEQGQHIAAAPGPPSGFRVNSGGDRITLEWDASPGEASGSFGGYRIYRAVARYDTTFEKIFECGAGTANPSIVHEYQDKSVIRGFSYYYYISSFDNGNNSTGHVLESSMFWTRTIEPAYLRRPAGSLSQIVVVPNPYNIRAASIQFPGETNKIMFYEVPGQCTIRIYTERGDLIRTIEHTDGSGDEPWDLMTKNGQIVVSGLYIAVFQEPNGDKAYRKFVVIR